MNAPLLLSGPPPIQAKSYGAFSAVAGVKREWLLFRGRDGTCFALRYRDLLEVGYGSAFSAVFLQFYWRKFVYIYGLNLRPIVQAIFDGECNSVTEGGGEETEIGAPFIHNLKRVGI